MTAKDFLALAEKCREKIANGEMSLDSAVHICCDDNESWYDAKRGYITDYGKGEVLCISVINERSPSLYEESEDEEQ